MKNIFIRKLLVSIVFAAAAPFVVVAIMKSMFAKTTLANGDSLVAVVTQAIQNPSSVYLVLAAVFFITTFIAMQLMPVRRRRNRSSGTIVEQDVEDGRERGVVKWFNVKKGFGFITWDHGEDVFVHFRSIRGQGHRSLTEGQRVKFHVVRGQKGPQAEDVSVVR